MTDTAALGALAFLLGVITLVLLCAGIVAGLRERAYQREVERRHAEEWRRIHKAHQDLGRYGDPNRPE